MNCKDAAALLIAACSLPLVGGCASFPFARSAAPQADSISQPAHGSELGLLPAAQPPGPEPGLRPLPPLPPPPDPAANLVPPGAAGDERIAVPEAELLPDVLHLNYVLDSVRQTYPLVVAAQQARTIAAGNQLQAIGSFDLKVAGEAIAQPLGDYENYRYVAGVTQPTWWGGSVFARYRLGDGMFEPWYQERETQEGGEVSAGIVYPLAQGRAIDARRAQIATAEWGRLAAEPEIQVELIEAVRTATYTYWQWLAAGQSYRISQLLLQTAQQRNEALERQVRAGEIEEISLVDNQRLILSREAKLIAAQQKLEQAAIKLSLFLRTPSGAPLIPPRGTLPPSFPPPEPIDTSAVNQDIGIALVNRPEVRELTFARRQLEIELELARNSRLPVVNTSLAGSQDLGAPANVKDDKGELILEAGVLVEVPLQRRQAAGKALSLEGKLAQNAAKLQFTQDKVVTDVTTAYAALVASYEQYQRASQAVELNRRMEQAEQRKLVLGASDLLLVNLREQATADAAIAEVEALLNYYQARADLDAARALEVTQLNQP